MTPFQIRQRGEGKTGCIVTLAVLGIAAAVALKWFPVYYSNSQFHDAVDFIATEGSRIPSEQVEDQVRAKAKEFEINEILKDRSTVSVVVLPSVGDAPGSCTIRLKYKRVIDFYGIYQYTIVTDESIHHDVYTNIR